jgi:hypothetical protein
MVSHHTTTDYGFWALLSVHESYALVQTTRPTNKGTLSNMPLPQERYHESLESLNLLTPPDDAQHAIAPRLFIRELEKIYSVRLGAGLWIPLPIPPLRSSHRSRPDFYAMPSFFVASLFCQCGCVKTTLASRVPTVFSVLPSLFIRL